MYDSGDAEPHVPPKLQLRYFVLGAAYSVMGPRISRYVPPVALRD